MSLAGKLSPLLFLLALSGAPLWAQDGDAQVSEAGEPAPGAADTPPGAAREDAPGRPPGDDDPFDYQASEEISEDLSVSFPVDI